MSRKEDIEYEEKKAKRFRTPDIDFYLIENTVESQTEAKVGIIEGLLGGKRETKKEVQALIVHDQRFGAMPYKVWEEAVKQTVMGTLRTSGHVSPADIPHADSIVVTASGSMYGGTICRECGLPIPTGCSRCPICYPQLGEPSASRNPT